MSHDIGEVVRLRATFTDVAGVATDPNTVALTTRSPSGVVAVYTDATNDPTAVGVFYRDVVPAEAGVWTYKWSGSGNLSAIEEATFTVAATITAAGSPGLYASVDDLKPMVDIELADTADDALLVRAIAAASRMIDRATRRRFHMDPEPTTRSYTADSDGYSAGYQWPGGLVDTDDIASDVGLVVTEDGTTTTDFTLEPVNAAADGRPWTRLWRDGSWSATHNAIEVTATFGWPAVPDVVVQAALIQASRIFKRRDAPFGIAGSPELGSELRLLARLDPDVAVMLRGVALR